MKMLRCKNTLDTFEEKKMLYVNTGTLLQVCIVTN